MTDIFFSYSSKDRERVRPVRDALVAEGFDVFWDQAVPAGVDWDTWIRSALQRSKCALVFWSENSIASDNVRHEATVAKTQGKLVPVLIEELRADQFPMGLYSVQGAKLTDWTPGTPSAEWDKLQAEVEAKLTPLWVSAKLHNAEAATLAEQARREAAESRIRALQGQLAKEAREQRASENGREAAEARLKDASAVLANLQRDNQALGDKLAEARERVASLERELQAAESRGAQAMVRLAEVPLSAPFSDRADGPDPAAMAGRKNSLWRYDILGRLSYAVALISVALWLWAFATRQIGVVNADFAIIVPLLTALIGSQLALGWLFRLKFREKWMPLIAVLGSAAIGLGMFNIFLASGFAFFKFR